MSRLERARVSFAKVFEIAKGILSRGDYLSEQNKEGVEKIISIAEREKKEE